MTSNTIQLKEHKVGDWSSNTYSTNASFVYSAKFAAPVLALLEPLTSNSKVLDLGCGSGELTIQIANKLSKNGLVIGADISSDMIRKAKELVLLDEEKEGGRNDKGLLEWYVLEGNKVNEVKEREFDAVFSSAAIHWMKSDPPRVVKNVHELLKVGGMFCGEFGGFMNMAGIRSALHSALNSRGFDAKALDPWYFPTETAYRSILEQAGFRVDSCELVPRITPLPTGLSGWLETFAFTFLEPLSISERKLVIQEVCDKLEVDFKSENGWISMYVRLRFVAVKL